MTAGREGGGVDDCHRRSSSALKSEVNFHPNNVESSLKINIGVQSRFYRTLFLGTSGRVPQHDREENSKYIGSNNSNMDLDTFAGI